MWEDPLSLLWENGILARNLRLQFCPLPMDWIFANALGTDFLQNGVSEKGRSPEDKIDGEVYHCIIPGNKRGENTQR